MAKKVTKTEETTGMSKSTARINGIIKQVGERAKQQQGDIALCASLIVIHAIAYKDVSPATRLIEAMGESTRKNDMRAWFIEFGPMRWADTKATDKDGKAIKGFLLNGEKREAMLPSIATAKEASALATKLRALPMWKWKKEAEFKPFDMDKEFQAFVKRAEARAKKGDTRDNVTNLAEYRKIAAEMAAKRVLEEAKTTLKKASA